eukprot:4325879-Prymnesium_polylepis.1
MYGRLLGYGNLVIALVGDGMPYLLSYYVSADADDADAPPPPPGPSHDNATANATWAWDWSNATWGGGDSAALVWGDALAAPNTSGA